MSAAPEPIPDDRCGNCWCPTQSLTRVGGYLVCLDCCEAATGPLWVRIAGGQEREHVYRRSPYDFCVECGRTKGYDGDGIHVTEPANTTNLLGGK